MLDKQAEPTFGRYIVTRNDYERVERTMETIDPFVNVANGND